MSAGWTDAWAVVSETHLAEFDAALDEAAAPCRATAVPHPFLRVRLRDIGDEVVLLMALSPNRCGQHHRVGPLRYAFPAEWEQEVRAILASHGIRAGVVPSVCYRLELRGGRVLDDLRRALLARAPKFGSTYPRIAVSQMSEVRDNSAVSRFEMEEEDATAFVACQREGNRMVLTHTEVPETMAGRGNGSKGVRGVLDRLRTEGGAVLDRCEFVAAYVERHPEYRDLPTDEGPGRAPHRSGRWGRGCQSRSGHCS